MGVNCGGFLFWRVGMHWCHLCVLCGGSVGSQRGQVWGWGCAGGIWMAVGGLCGYQWVGDALIWGLVLLCGVGLDLGGIVGIPCVWEGIRGGLGAACRFGEAVCYAGGNGGL